MTQNVLRVFYVVGKTFLFERRVIHPQNTKKNQNFLKLTKINSCYKKEGEKAPLTLKFIKKQLNSLMKYY
ncbi:hypothetical protein AT265_08945 [Bacillus cereus]|nr:hypothetical protein AT265_08945 [Bacillus cereus]PEE29833.1 hypothetical protein CON98_11640 [Bacillus toyonensis]PFY26167.1 hypothetical protein COL44_10765 [Bacillus toyonensis]